MATEAITLEQLHEDIVELKREISEVKQGIEDLRDVELHVKPEYLKKIEKIKTEKFYSREELEKELEE